MFFASWSQWAIIKHNVMFSPVCQLAAPGAKFAVFHCILLTCGMPSQQCPVTEGDTVLVTKFSRAWYCMYRGFSSGCRLWSNWSDAVSNLHESAVSVPWLALQFIIAQVAGVVVHGTSSLELTGCAQINKVTEHQAWLALRWVTIHGISSSFVTGSLLGQLSLLPSVAWKMSAGQGSLAVLLFHWEGDCRTGNTLAMHCRLVIYILSFYPQMPIGKVWIYRLLFVCLFFLQFSVQFCTVTVLKMETQKMQVLHFLVLTFGLAFSGPAFSSVSSFWSPIFRSCIFSRPSKASGVKFCSAIHRRPGQGITHFGKLPRKPKIGRIGQPADHVAVFPACRPIRPARRPCIGSACVDIGQSPLTYLYIFYVFFVPFI